MVTIMDVRTLAKFDVSDKENLGFYGYRSKGKYVVTKTEEDDLCSIQARYETLEKEYIREWTNYEDEFSDLFEKIIPLGLSLGAYSGDELLGVIITEPRKWNNTLWIWHIHVSENHRHEGIGRTLLDSISILAADKGFRAVGLEVQNYNVPAIKLYKRMGFEIDGIDCSYYTNDDMANGEVAFFMKKKLI